MPKKQTTTNEGARFRSLSLSREAIDVENRTVDLAFSSELPVERWDGAEILDHSPESVRLGRLASGGPILVDHDHRDHVGVIESVTIDSDRRGRVVARFGNSARADEIFNDVKDGIRSLVSVGYRVFKAIADSRDEDGNVDAYRVTDWEPFEVSFVSVPADASVGVGREAEDKNDFIIETREAEAPAKPAAETEQLKQEERIMPDKKVDPTPAGPNAEEIRVAANTDALARTTSILDAGEAYARFGGDEVAQEVLRSGGDLESFNKMMLSRMGKAEPVAAGSPEAGLSEREAESFSFMRALHALANPHDKSAQDAAGFEFEASRAAAKARGTEAQGIMVPIEVLKRDLVAGTDTAGGHTVSTDLMAGSFIDLLVNRSILMSKATVMGGLNGNIAIPRQTGGASSYWVAESGAPTESQAAFDQVTLSPETVGAFTDVSRKLMLQSSIDTEAFIRMDLARTLALAIDLAGLWGDGTGNSPTGIANQSGVNLLPGATNGAAPSWASIVQMETLVAADNADVGSLGYIINAVTRGKLKTTEKAANTAQFLWEQGNTVNGYGVDVTNQIPANLTKGSGTALSGAIFGNFADLIIGMWGGLDLTVDPYSQSTSGTVRVVALQDCDLAVRHPESFAVAKDFII